MSVTDELAGMTEIALFAGGGGGVLGSKMLGIRTVAYVEWDAYPQAVLKARMADGLIETAPVFGDVREFDTAPYAGKVDIVSGGFPCQPFSTAGRREADFDPRNMWPATRDIIRGVRPKYAYLENVAGLLTGTHGYFGVVIGELARSGYDVAWTCLPAAAVGAPHRRDRMWILGRRRDVESTDTVPLAEFARFDEKTLSWRSGPGRCRGDTASTVTASVPWPRSGFVRTGTDGSVVVYALDPVSQADGTTRDGWPWPRILEDLRIPDPLAGARPAAPDAPGVEMLPTPNAFDAHAVGASRAARRPEWGRHGVSLHHLAADWSARGGRTYPTPLAGNATPGEGGNHGGMALRAAAIEAEFEHTRTWPTPTVQGLNGGSGAVAQISNLISDGGVDAGEIAIMFGRDPGNWTAADAAIEEADGIDDFLQALDGSNEREWPTPMASNNRKSRRALLSKSQIDGGQGSPPGLAQAVELASGIIPKELAGVDPDTLPPATRAMWPTPNAGMYRQDVHDSGQYAEDIAEKGRQITLAAAVKLRPDKTWPTPQASRVANDVNVRTAAQRSPDSPPNKLGWAVGEAEDGDGGDVGAWPTPRAKGLAGGSSIHDFRENLVADGVGGEDEISAMFQLAPRTGVAPEQASQTELELDLDDLEDFASGRVQWHLVSPSVKMTPGYFPTPTACDAFGNNVDGWSPLGRFIQNNNVRPPRRSKEERDAARANRGPVGQLNPDWVEWLMGWPVGWTSMSPMTDAEAQAYAADMPGPWWRREPPHVPRITVGTPDRAARLKACGNGQVPLCNAAAFEVLLETYRQIGVACAHVPDEELDAFDLLGL